MHPSDNAHGVKLLEVPAPNAKVGSAALFMALGGSPSLSSSRRPRQWFPKIPAR
jgi:hypothetical protein